MNYSELHGEKARGSHTCSVDVASSARRFRGRDRGGTSPRGATRFEAHRTPEGEALVRSVMVKSRTQKRKAAKGGVRALLLGTAARFHHMIGEVRIAKADAIAFIEQSRFQV